MNRIIIIGNGFDMAHNLKTGYRDFIDDYWNNVTEKVFGGYDQWLKENWGGMDYFGNYKDEFVGFEKKYGKTEINKSSFPCKKGTLLEKLYTLIDEYNNDPNTPVTVHLKFKNRFFERISHQCSLVNWVDIENEYYDALKELLQKENTQKQNESIRTLNKEFDDVKRLLEKYLTEITKKTEIAKHQSIQDAFSSFVEFDDIANCKQTVYANSIFAEMVHANTIDEFENDRVVDKTYKYCLTENEARIIFIEKKLKDESFKKYHLLPYTLLLNFNYTQTAKKLYNDHNIDEIINIHGELNSENNPIIFGYGDELDDDYNKIEKLQNNDFLENIKSISYHKTRNYRELLNFISLGPYQVFIMGHSCGNSDRTLLNTLFEHDNCISIKVFYRQYEDGADNYIDLIKNISRNFNNKPNMRDIVVNRENCSPLVPIETEVAE
ncbi:AbiH family protein [Bacteroides xylanisolvens]|uniref:AbiH family protein n=1 Tax=Bacteroides xylanisolvens TaxID=371601 RepID=UPI001F5A5B87|nr:AbiH family protein [Bacteroides xylanisolvens]